MEASHVWHKVEPTELAQITDYPLLGQFSKQDFVNDNGKTVCSHEFRAFRFPGSVVVQSKGVRPNNFHSPYRLFLCFSSGRFFGSPVLLGLMLTVVMDIFIRIVLTQRQLSLAAKDIYQLRGVVVFCLAIDRYTPAVML